MIQKLAQVFAFQVLSFLLVPAFAQVEGESSFSQCIRNTAGGPVTFILKSDSSLMYRPSGERWKAATKKIGIWRKENGVVVLYGKEETQRYEVDTIRSVQFLIPLSLTMRWSTIKKETAEKIANDQDLQMIMTSEIKNEQQDRRQKTIKRLEYEIALRNVCGEEILVRNPAGEE